MINQASIVRYTASVCEIIFSDFRKKTFSAESIRMSDADKARLTLWEFVSGLKSNIVRELGIKRWPLMTLNFGEWIFSTDYVKWSGYLPRVALRKDPDSLVQEACASPTIVLVSDIRRSQDLMTYAESPTDFSNRMNRFIEVTRFTLEKYGGFFDKFTGDGFIAYFNESICKVSGWSHRDGFLGFLREYSDFAECHFRDWATHVKKLPDKIVGLALGADIGTISLQNLNHHVIAVGDAIVWASRLAQVTDANEILINNLLYESLRKSDGLKFEECAETIKSGETILARILSLQKPNV